MAKAKKGSKKSKSAVRVVKVASFDVNQKVLSAAKALIKKGEDSKVEVIRTIAKRFKGERRGVIEATFVKGLKFNLGTVRRQIQEGRAA